MTETIATPTLLVLLILIVQAWIIVGIRDRRAWRREANAWRSSLSRHQSAKRSRLCAHTWWVNSRDGYGVCTLRHEHDGPHLDHITGHMRR